MYYMHINTIIIYVGNSMVPATGLFGWQYNISNGVIFVSVLVQILIFVCRRIGTAVILFIGHRHLGRT